MANSNASQSFWSRLNLWGKAVILGGVTVLTILIIGVVIALTSENEEYEACMARHNDEVIPLAGSGYEFEDFKAMCKSSYPD